MATKTTKAADTAGANENQAENAEVMVDVFIPLDPNNEGNDKFYCSVNGEAMLIPMGEHVSVPARFGYAILNAQAEAKRVREDRKAREQLLKDKQKNA